MYHKLTSFIGNSIFRSEKKVKYVFFCVYFFRSETPLIYKAVPSWFIRVEQAQELLLGNNAQTYW